MFEGIPKIFKFLAELGSSIVGSDRFLPRGLDSIRKPRMIDPEGFKSKNLALGHGGLNVYYTWDVV